MQLLTLSEVAQKLNISKATAYRLVWAGTLPALRIAPEGRRGTLRVLETDLIAYLQSLREGKGENSRDCRETSS